MKVHLSANMMLNRCCLLCKDNFLVKYYIDWMNSSSEWESEEHPNQASAKRRAAELEAGEVSHVFIGKLCPKCNRSRNDARRCRDYFHTDFME